mgnify:CR=1 FL=1
MAYWLAPKTVGQLLGITTAGVIELEKRGKLKCVRDSLGRRLFKRAEVQRLMTARSDPRWRKAHGRRAKSWHQAMQQRTQHLIDQQQAAAQHLTDSNDDELSP